MIGQRFNPGEVITFAYNKLGTSDKSPVIVIVSPLYNGKVPGINVNYLTIIERKALLGIIDKRYINGLEPFPHVKLLVESKSLDLDIKVPDLFWRKYVKQVISSDAYRMYMPNMMAGIRQMPDKKIILTSRA